MKIKPIDTFFSLGKNIFLNIMRMIILLFFSTAFCFSPIHGLSQNEKIILKEDQTLSVDEVFQIIENQTPYHFIYRSDMFKNAPKIGLKKGGIPIKQLLQTSFSATKFTFKVSNKNIIVTKDAGVQEQTITGVVTDENGVPLPGVNVIVKGTSQGTSTDFDGNYEIKAEQGQTLRFSSVGFSDQTKTIGSADEINVVMEKGSALDEVVVTALGIKQSERSLTSAQQSISAEDITGTKQINFASSLSGKVAGVNLKSSSSGAGGSSKIKIRGTKSITGVSSPLFVIDGIPMLNSIAGAREGDMYENMDNGDGLSQINPEDIAEITVLKGSNSAALYGSAGANGVILVTTKDGEPGKLHGSVSSSAQIKTILKKPDLQFRYGQKGETSSKSWSYDKGDYDNFVNDFFDTGVQLTNSLSLSGGSEESLTYVSYANTTAEGVIPENKYLRNNVTFKQKNKFFDGRLQVSSRIMLSDEKKKNRPATGFYFNPLTGLYLFPRNLDFDQYKEYQVFNEDRNMMTQNWFLESDSDKQQNPYWIIHNNRTDNRKKRLIANVAINYDINEHMNIQARGNYDRTRRSWEQKMKAGTSAILAEPNGRYRMGDYTDTKIYADAIFNYNNDFGKFNLDLNLGGSFEKTEIGTGVETAPDNASKGLKYANVFSLQNYKGLISETMSSQLEKQGVFGTVRLGYDNAVYLDFSGRNDWSSTLAYTDNSSYFYPSVGTSIILSEFIDMPDFVSYGKIRASYSKVSNEVPAFISNPTNSIDDNGVVINTEKPFRELKPEDQYSFEIGTDWKFFNNRLGIDFTYYKIDNKDQFIPLDAPSGSSYSVYYVNAGHIRNTGFELALHATPVQSEDFEWTTSINYSSNKNEILKLHEDLPGRYTMIDQDLGYASYIEEGGSSNDMYGFKFVRDDQGRIKVDADGAPQKTSQAELLGTSDPDFLLGWNNRISFKDWSLSFLIDSRVGGNVISGTGAMLDAYGVSERTAVARDQGAVEINGVDPDGNAVASVDPKTFYDGVTGGGTEGILENYLYKATNVRLREVALTYSFDFNDTSFFDSASVSLIGNNLFFLYKDAPFDPDLAFSNGRGFGGYDLFSAPSLRTFGINLNLKF